MDKITEQMIRTHYEVRIINEVMDGNGLQNGLSKTVEDELFSDVVKFCLETFAILQCVVAIPSGNCFLSFTVKALLSPPPSFSITPPSLKSPSLWPSDFVITPSLLSRPPPPHPLEVRVKMLNSEEGYNINT